MFKYVQYTPFTDAYTTHIFNEKDDTCVINRFDVPVVSVECETERDFTGLMVYQSSDINAVEITLGEFNEMVKNSDQVQRMYNVANGKYFNSMHPVNTKHSATERETWVTQVAESNKYFEDGTVGTMIGALAAALDTSVSRYASYILANKAEYDQFASDGAIAKESLLSSLKEEVGIFPEDDVMTSWVTGV